MSIPVKEEEKQADGSAKEDNGELLLMKELEQMEEVSSDDFEWIPGYVVPGSMFLDSSDGYMIYYVVVMLANKVKSAARLNIEHWPIAQVLEPADEGS